MNLKLENKSDFVEAFKELENRIIALENAKGSFFKPDIIGKMPKPLADALVKARSECLPLQKSMTSKDGKVFPNLADYTEATNNAFAKNGISIVFMENDEPTPTLVAVINLKGSRETYTITTEVKPANMQDPKKAMFYGFQNSRKDVYKTLSLLK
jgi:hypothetical protein